MIISQQCDINSMTFDGWWGEASPSPSYRCVGEALPTIFFMAF